MILLSINFCRSVRFAAYNQFIWWSNGKLEDGIHKRVQLCSYGNQVQTSLSSYGYQCANLGIPIPGEVEEKKELKNLPNFHIPEK